jgi:ubiquinone/menaquinone biosynthesis C-methylase UbiE
MTVKQTKYSAEHPEVWIPRDEPNAKKDTVVLAKIFNKYGKVKSVLDVGCGLGTHCYFLDKLGYTCEGVEPHSKMVERARKKYPGIKFNVGAMQDINYKNQFDAVICVGSIIVFDRTNEEVFQTFKKFNRALKKNGILIIESSNPIRYIQGAKFKKSFQDVEKSLGVKVLYDEYIDERKQTYVSSRAYFDLKTGKKVGFFSKESRMFFPQELKFFLEQAGFKVIEMFSADSFEKISLNYTKMDKWRMLVVARRG